MLKKALALFGKVAELGPSEFDPVFYGTYYPDLQIFKTKSALLKHYLRHGKAEGRFQSLAAARAHFEALNRPPPADFDVNLYQQLNPDLAKRLSNAIQYELHFLEFGRFEDRPYAPHSGRSEDGWRKLFNLYDFVLLNESWLPDGRIDRARALELFEADGVSRLAPIARGWAFDPVFYRANHHVADGDEASLYRDWLQSGFPAGRAPNETRAIFSYAGGRPYPTCFDWRSFCQARHIDASNPAVAKIKAIEHLFESPLDDAARSCITGTGAGRLYEMIGEYNLIRARHRRAADAFRLACATPEATAKTYLTLGDALEALGETNEALVEFRQALSRPDCSVWALVHAVKIMLSMKMFREAMRLVEGERDRFCAHELFDGFADEVATTVYQSVADTMKSMISDDRQDDVLDTYADTRLDELIAFIRATKLRGGPIKLAATEPRRVVMLACLDLAQCTFYRVEQKRRLLEQQGIALEVFNFDNPAPFMSALPGAAAAIFYRVPCYPNIVRSMIYADHLGIDTFFDIDDLVFTRDFPDSYDSYERQITRQEYFGLCHGVALYRHAIALCDGAIVSTRPLADRIAPMVAGGRERTFVVPNGLDDRSDTALRYGRSRPEPGATVTIFYGSGTKAHNRDFTDLVAPALLEVLTAYPRSRLVIVGYLKLDARFDAFGERISRFSFIGDLSTYWAVLATCDVNISVLHDGPLADCKSEIKWLEAAMLGIPSIVSATATYRDVLTDGSTGLLARTSEDWLRHLRSLIEDHRLRESIGARARELALREYSGPAVAAKLMVALEPREEAVEKRRLFEHGRTRLLVCNVFFAPQSYGGATRVVEDNVDQLLDRYGDEFEISILSSYKGLSVGALRVDSYRGCPVYRIGTPLEVNMDWRPFNDDDILPAFRRVLEVARPDLVHFHCVQRLTASIVEETLQAGVPYLVTVHDAWWISDHQFLVDQTDSLVDLDEPFETSLPTGVSRPESLQRQQRLKSLLNAAVATLAVSRSFADLYRKAGIGNVRVCENGLGALQPPREKVTPHGRIVLGHIGGRTVHKGAALVEVVLKSNAFDKLALLLIDGTLETGEEHHELWGSTPVTIRAPVERSAVDRLYSQIDVLLAPSIWPESYGLVSREALFYETWVVASNRGAMAQDITVGANGFVIDPSTSKDLAGVLSEINANVDRYKERPTDVLLRSSSSQVDEMVAEYRAIEPGAAEPATFDKRAARKKVAAPIA